MLSKKIGLPDYFLTDSRYNRYSYIGKSTDGNIGIGATLNVTTNTSIQAATSYENHIPHVKSGQHEAMLFTEWLNPQIILITATIAKTGTQAKMNNPPSFQ